MTKIDITKPVRLTAHALRNRHDHVSFAGQVGRVDKVSSGGFAVFFHDRQATSFWQEYELENVPEHDDVGGLNYDEVNRFPNMSDSQLAEAIADSIGRHMRASQGIYRCIAERVEPDVKRMIAELDRRVNRS